MKNDDITKSKVYKANIKYHSKLADSYDETQPHFKKENVKQVRNRLEHLSKFAKDPKLLDIGCGTGFILELAHDYYNELYGVDITPAMIKKAKNKFKTNKIKLFLASSDNLPFSDSYFDVVTAYGFLHHLPILIDTFKEVHRVLKKGGIFYADQDPNYYFWEAIKSLPNRNLSSIIDIERKSVCKMVTEVQNVVGKDLDRETIEMAEYLKSKGGLKEEEIKEYLHNSGFNDIDYEYAWYWQEGKVIKDLSEKDAIYFENHLRLALPLTKSFFKYFRFEARK